MEDDGGRWEENNFINSPEVDQAVDDEIALKFGPSAKIYLHTKDKIRIIHFVTEKFGTSHKIIHAVSINDKFKLQASCKNGYQTQDFN